MKGCFQDEKALHRWKTDISYTLHGDYYLPDFALPAEEENHIGIRGQRHAAFLKEYKRNVYNEFLFGGNLQTYLAQVVQNA